MGAESDLAAELKKDDQDHVDGGVEMQRMSRRGGCYEQGIRAEEYMRCIMIFYGITARLSYQTMQIGFLGWHQGGRHRRGVTRHLPLIKEIAKNL